MGKSWQTDFHNVVHFYPDGSLDTNLNVDEENIKLYKKGKYEQRV